VFSVITYFLGYGRGGHYGMYKYHQLERVIERLSFVEKGIEENIEFRVGDITYTVTKADSGLSFVANKTSKQ
jgi:hypothetical protein